MDQINVQRWASSLRQFRRNDLQPPIVTDGCVCHSPNRVRNNATKIKVNESSNDIQKDSFILDEKRNFMSEDFNRISKSQFYTYDMSTKDEENLYSLPMTQYSDNRSSDLDTVSDAGTYIIEDDQSERKFSSFKRYINHEKHRHGTFDVQGLLSSTAHTIHRPVVDANITKQDLSSSLSSSNSSLLSFNDDEEKISFVPQQSSTPPPRQSQIKPAEAFVISPIYETKSFPTRNFSRSKLEDQSKSKLLTKLISTKESNLEPISSLTSAQTNQSPTEKYSFHLPKQPPSLKISTRPHTMISDQKSSFQRQTTSANTQFQRQTSSLSTTDNDQTTPNLTKPNLNKPFILRQQRSNVTSSTSKPLSRQPLKFTSSVTTNSNHQTNRAVELRRARAQAKIEELAQRTKKQFYKPNHSMDTMSVSWHSHPTSNNKKDLSNLRIISRIKTAPQKEDLSATRTISSSLYQRSLSDSPTSVEEIQEQNHPKISASEEGRCDSLRDDGQRLAIRLIQLSSGILEKLKPNDLVSVHELEQLVDQLQTVNRTLSSIDAALTGPIHDNLLV